MSESVYLLIGLVMAGVAGYIANELLPEKDKPLSVVVGWGMIVFWLPVIGVLGLVALLGSGLVLGKLLFKGRKLVPKLQAAWKALE